MRWVLAALAALASAAVSAADPRPTTVKVLWVTVDTGPDGRTCLSLGTGSGTVVGGEDAASLVLTNHHVVPDARRDIYVVPWGESRPVKASFLRHSTRADLALLRVPRRLPAAEVAGAAPPPGARLRFWGRSFDGPPVYREGPAEGTVPGHLQHEGAAGYRLTNPAPNYYYRVRPEIGDSGCGLFDDRDRLVGVNHARRETDGMGIGTSAEDVRRFLADAEGGSP